MARPSRETLATLLKRAASEHSVAYPGETFCDLVVMALEAAETHPSPSFTTRELETLLLSCTDQDAVQMDAGEFKALVELAMHVAPPLDAPGL
jgi:hypothetical protein